MTSSLAAHDVASCSSRSATAVPHSVEPIKAVLDAVHPCHLSLSAFSLFQCDMLDAEDDGHAHILLVGCFCMQGAAQGEIQLLGWHMQWLRHQGKIRKR